MAVLHPTASEFDALLKNEPVVLADFFASWCGPCKMIAPLIEELAATYEGKAAIVKIDVDENQALAARYGVMSVPTVLLFQNGELAATEVGARPLAYYSGKLDEMLS